MLNVNSISVVCLKSFSSHLQDFVAFFEIVYAVFFEKFSHGFVYYFHASGVEHAACVEDYEFYHGCFWCWLRDNCFSTAPHAGFMDFAVRFLL